jgi:DNA-binding response OmpR family regulator
MSGLAICRLIRTKLGSDLPIIILSGDNSIETLNEIAAIGVAHFFNKPVRASDLLHRLREILPA